MPSEMEKLLGSKISPHKDIKNGKADNIIFISYKEKENPGNIFDDVVWNIDPPLAKNGGATLSGISIELPNLDHYFSISVTGDIENWIEQVTKGCSNLGRKAAKVIGSNLVVNDGRQYPLSDCKIVYD
jgi:hypothetical protein